MQIEMIPAVLLRDQEQLPTLRDAADVALGLGDTRAARAYVGEGAPGAAALDRQREVTGHSDELEQCPQGLPHPLRFEV